MVFEEDITKIAEALRTALQHFPSYKQPDKNLESDSKSKMELTKEKFENAYKSWTNEEDDLLTQLYIEGKTPKELSDVFKRNIGAINSRIEKLELKELYK